MLLRLTTELHPSISPIQALLGKIDRLRFGTITP